MQVSKWGNSLAIRLPAAVVEALDLKEGDDIEVQIADARTFAVSRDRSRQRALENLRHAIQTGDLALEGLKRDRD